MVPNPSEVVQLGAIFISYRRSDSQGEAGRLFDDLVNHFGEDLVFMDVAGIEAGRDFRKAIEESVAQCGVLLVVMGPEWLNTKDEHGTRRLDDPADFVRIETASALKRDIPVIPILVRGAEMPRAEHLPEDIKELAYRNCVELTHARWKSDIHLLTEALRRLLGEGGRAEMSRAAEMRLGSSRQQASDKEKSGDSPGVDPAALERVSRELAVQIGPIADIVVRRAAARCASLDALYLQVAEEIEAPAEREKFLSRAPAAASSSFHVASAAELPRVRVENPETAARPDGNEEEPKQAQRSRNAATPTRRYTALFIAGAGVLVAGMIFVGLRFGLTKGGGGAPVLQSTVPQSTSPQAPVALASAPDNIPASARTPARVEKTIAPHETEEGQPRTAERIRISQGVAQGLLVSKVVPAYPPLARQARIQGAVLLQANISKTGKVEDLRLISGHPMLVSAAIEAVKQWRYKPFLVNGEAVAVETQVAVNFTLTGG